MLAHMMGRTFVLPGHMRKGIHMLDGRATVEDFYDFSHLGGWVKIITMHEYLDTRCAALFPRLVNTKSICVTMLC